VTDHNADADRYVILVADDDQVQRFMAREALEASGFTVIEAVDGERALEAFQISRPDAVILDIMMPGRNGFEACEALRASPEGEHVPVLMVTGLDDMESIQRAYDVGATSFVTKPINYLILNHRLNYILRAQANADNLLRKSEQLLTAQRIAKLGYWEWDVDRDVAVCSEGMCDILGMAQGPTALRYTDLLAMIHEEDRARVHDLVTRSADERRDYAVEYRVVRSDGSERIVHQETRLVVDSNGRLVQVTGTTQDVTEHRQVEEKAWHLSCFDDTTGLPNRTFLRELLEQEIAAAKHDARVVVVMALEIDSLSRVNDTLGRAAGDELLRQFSERLAGSLRGGDTVFHGPCAEQPKAGTDSKNGHLARMSGHEFGLLLTRVRRVEDSAKVAQRIIDILGQPFVLDQHEVSTGICVGISAFPHDGEDCDALLKNADAAMSFARERGRNTFQFYTRSIEERAVRRFTLENDLRKALDRDQFAVHYQPRPARSLPWRR